MRAALHLFNRFDGAPPSHGLVRHYAQRPDVMLGNDLDVTIGPHCRHDFWRCICQRAARPEHIACTAHESNWSMMRTGMFSDCQTICLTAVLALARLLCMHSHSVHHCVTNGQQCRFETRFEAACGLDKHSCSVTLSTRMPYKYANAPTLAAMPRSSKRHCMLVCRYNTLPGLMSLWTRPLECIVCKSAASCSTMTATAWNPA